MLTRAQIQTHLRDIGGDEEVKNEEKRVKGDNQDT